MRWIGLMMLVVLVLGMQPLRAQDVGDPPHERRAMVAELKGVVRSAISLKNYALLLVFEADGRDPDRCLLLVSKAQYDRARVGDVYILAYDERGQRVGPAIGPLAE